jgi:hypothetical protein
VWANLLVEWYPIETADGMYMHVNRSMIKLAASLPPSGDNKEVQPGRKYISLCYQFRCSGGQSAIAMRKAGTKREPGMPPCIKGLTCGMSPETQARVDTFIGQLQNQVLLPRPHGRALSIDHNG